MESNEEQCCGNCEYFIPDGPEYPDGKCTCTNQIYDYTEVNSYCFNHVPIKEEKK